jgi:hypothetical protein
MDYRFVRSIDPIEPIKFEPKKLIIIGSGAVENSYVPLIRAVEKFPLVKIPAGMYGGIYNDHSVIMHSLANSYFKYRIFREKFLHEISSRTLRMPKHKGMLDIISDFSKLRRGIADEFASAKSSNEIALSAKCVKLLSEADWSETAVITTNWDELVWDIPSCKNLIQLHGRSTFRDSLIVPTEMSFDENVLGWATKCFDINSLDEASKEVGRDDFEKIFEDVSRNSSQAELHKAHQTALYWLDSAKEITFFGVALNVYDAELNSVLFARDALTKGQYKKVTNINPDRKSNSVIGAITLTNPLHVINPLMCANDNWASASHWIKSVCRIIRRSR